MTKIGNKKRKAHNNDPKSVVREGEFETFLRRFNDPKSVVRKGELKLLIKRLTDPSSVVRTGEMKKRKGAHYKTD